MVCAKRTHTKHTRHCNSARTKRIHARKNDTNLHLLLHIQKQSSTFAANFKIMYRTPDVYIADIEVLTGKSYRTAQRIMAKIRKYYNLAKHEKPTLDQVKEYLKE